MVEVYFDDFKVTQIKSPVVASDDYYPGGALFNSYTRENSVINKRKYQGKEWQTELGLELYDFGRPYDPWTLHTITQDAHAENYYAWSPYSWSFDNPTRFIDPTGMDPEDPISIGSLLNKAVEAAGTIIDFIFGGGNDGSAESAAGYGEAHNTMQAVGVEAQNMKSELEGTLGQVPGLNVALNVMDASQAKTTGETMQHLGKAALNANSIPIAGGAKSGGGKYSNLPEPKTVGPGRNTTPAQRGRILEQNKTQNGGQMRSDGDGRVLNKPTKMQKGQKADMNQAEVDHSKAKSKGGTNSNSNLRVISKEENLRKGNRDQ